MKDENGKIIFDADEQAKIDEIVKERLARHKPEDYDALKELEQAIEEFDYKGTPKEKAAALKEFKAKQREAIEAAEREERAKEQGTSPDVLKRIEDAEKKAQLANEKLEAMEKKETEGSKQEQMKKQQEENYQIQRKELLEKHEVDADDLEKNPRFMKFIKGKTGINLIEEYEDFIELIGETEAETIKKVMSKEARSTSGSKTQNAGNHGLDSDQMKTLEEWNRKYPHMAMTAKEFKSK